MNGEAEGARPHYPRGLSGLIGDNRQPPGTGEGQLGAGHSPALQGKSRPEIHHLPHQLLNLFLHLRHIQEPFDPTQQPGLIHKTELNYTPLSAVFKQPEMGLSHKCNTAMLI